MHAEQLTDRITHHGEGAVWSASWGGLRCVDMYAGDVLSISPDGSLESRQHVGSDVAAMVRPRAGGGMVVATRRGFALFTEHGPTWRTPPLWERDMRFNEGACDPLGRVLCGTIAADRSPGSGEMWRLDLDGSTHRVLDSVTISNGLGFTADGSRAYYVDTRTRRVDLFDFIDDELVARRPLIHLPEGVGNPDGLCVDAEDGLWIALYGGGAVHHYRADGALQEVLEIPGVSRVTSCTLGGDDLRTLYVTTSREGLADDDEPLAGSLFTAWTSVPGLPVLTAAL